jgi:hypothetical protein
VQEGRGMADILLSSPLVWLYLLYLAALVIAHFCAGRPNPSGREEDRRGCWSGRGIRLPRTSGDGGPGLPAGRLRRETESRELLPAREPAASCSADYAARFAQAIGRIRMR